MAVENVARGVMPFGCRDRRAQGFSVRFQFIGGRHDLKTARWLAGDAADEAYPPFTSGD